MLRVLTLATLFPDASRPNFGVFVERQTLGLAARPGVDLRVVAPIGVPPWPLARLGHHRAFAAVPEAETSHWPAACTSCAVLTKASGECVPTCKVVSRLHRFDWLGLLPLYMVKALATITL